MNQIVNNNSSNPPHPDAVALLRQHNISVVQLARVSKLSAPTVKRALISPSRSYALTVSHVRTTAERLLRACGAQFDSKSLWSDVKDRAA